MEYLDLTAELLFDTYLSIKMGKEDGGTTFVHYITHRERKNGAMRTYGDVYNYFTSKEGFRFAIGYILEEDVDGRFWKARTQYFYFDRKELPYLKASFLKSPLFCPKNHYIYKPHL